MRLQPEEKERERGRERGSEGGRELTGPSGQSWILLNPSKVTAGEVLLCWASGSGG